jgi:ribonuclease M5
MLYTDKAIVVEGRYDKIRLSGVVDALIITTDGFHIFNDKEKQRFIKKTALEKGLLILTDSDAAGFKIRNLIKNIVPEDRVTHVFIPDIFGKEKRKDAPSKEGKLGVEGIDNKILTEALLKSGAFTETEKPTDRQEITTADLYEAGLTGGVGSAEKRRAFLEKNGLPARLTGKTMLQAINMVMTRQEFLQQLTINN